MRECVRFQIQEKVTSTFLGVKNAPLDPPKDLGAAVTDQMHRVCKRGFASATNYV